MAIRMSPKDGRTPRNLLEGTGNLKQRYYKDKSFQENLRASQARVEQANLEAESATRFADRVDTAKNFGRSVFDFVKAAPKYIVGSTGAVLVDSPFSPLAGKVRSIKLGDTEFLTPSARFKAGQDLLGQGQYKQGIREIGTGALDIASTVATPLKSLQALRVGKFGKAFLTGAVPTGLFGAGYQGLESFGADKTPAEIAKDMAYTGVVSFAAGGGFGLGLAGLGKGGEMIAKRLGRGEKITPAEIAKITSETTPDNKTEVKPPVKTSEKSEQKVNDEDAAFVAAVEERFKKSKTNKFRETKDEKGRFTGSTKKSGDAARDDLASSIENRINAIPDNSVENFGYREDLRAIQTKVANAKPADLPALKAQSDRIAQERLDKRALTVRPKVDKERKIAFTRTVANESDNFNEFQLNLKKRGEDITTIFKSKAAAEEFFRKNSGAKYRTAPDNPLLQEARKYKSAEEFVKAQGTPIYHGTTKKFDEYKLPATYEGGRARAVFFAENKKLAEKYAYGKGNVKENILDPSAKIFDYTNPEHQKIVFDLIDAVDDPRSIIPGSLMSKEGLKKAIQYGDYYAIESKAVQKLLKKKGFDGFTVMDYGNKAIGITNTSKIKTKSQLTDLYNKAQGGKNRLADDFERVTGQKITPEQEAKIVALNKKLFGDEDVKITAQLLTPEGQKAFGVYKNKVIKILDGQADPTDTFYHEAVHKYLDLFTTLDEQKRIYLEARKLWKTDNLDELEEKIAENFIRYAKTNEGVVGTMKVLFDQVIDRIKVALNGESQIEAMYKDILEGKAKKAPEQPKPSGVSESPVLKELNRTLSEAERVNTDLPTTTFKKEFSESVERINADPKKAYNDAVYGSKGEGAQTRSSLQLALLENAKSKGDDKAIAEIGMAAAKHARRSGQEVAMFRALYDADPTNKLLIDLAGTKLKNIESRYPKILRRIFKESGDDAVTSATKIVKKKAPTIKEAQSIIDNFICK